MSIGQGLKIAEVARRSGFSPATLRSYEDIGLVPPAGRTDAGYRLYDERSLDRLAFIARAKQLDCSLEEIAELVGAWEGNQCAPVQHQLRSLVGTKLADAQVRIAELVALSSDLQAAATALAAEPVDGPCSDGCGCATAVASASSASVAVAARGQANEHRRRGAHRMLALA